MDTPKIEKFSNTISIQLDLAIEELLAEAYHEKKYNGIIEITWNLNKTKKEAKLEVSSKDLLIMPKKRQLNSLYFQVSQDRGVKKL